MATRVFAVLLGLLVWFQPGHSQDAPQNSESIESKKGSAAEGVAGNLRAEVDRLVNEQSYDAAAEVAQRLFQFARQNEDANLILEILLLQMDLEMSRRDFNAAIRFNTSAAELSRTEFGEDHFRTRDVKVWGDHLARLRVLSKEQRRVIDAVSKDEIAATERQTSGDHAQAIALLNDAFRRRSEVFGESDPTTAETLRRLGWANMNHNELERAEETFRKSLKVHRKLYGDRHPKAADSMTQLGALYAVRLGRPGEALVLFQDARAIYEACLGAVADRTLTTLGNIAFACEGMRQIENAEKAYRELILRCETRHGRMHEAVLQNLDALAILMQNAGHYAEAERLFRDSLERSEESSPDAVPTAIRYGNLGVFYAMQLGHYSKAIPLLQRSLDSLTTSMGPDHVSTLEMMSKLGFAYQRLREFDKAVEFHSTALRGFAKTVGREHGNYALALHHLGMIALQQDQYSKSMRYLEQAAEIRAKILGAEHADYAISLQSLALAAMAIGDLGKAESAALRSIEIVENVYGKSHLNVAPALSVAGVLYADHLGQFDQALKMFERGHKIYQTYLGDSSRETLRCLSNVAVAHQNLGHFDRAEELHRYVLAAYREKFGQEHLDTGLSYLLLGGFYESIGSDVDATESFRNAWQVFREVAGEGASITINASIRLATMQQRSGQEKAAQDRYEKIFWQKLALSKAVVPGLSGAEIYSWNLRPIPDGLLSLLRRQQEILDEEAYQYVWWSKGLVDRLKHRSPSSGTMTEEAVKISEELSVTRNLLSRLMFQSASNNMDEFRRAALRKESLERQLASMNPTSRRELELRDSTINDLVKHLPDEVVIVDVMRTTDWRPMTIGDADLAEDPVEQDSNRAALRPIPVYDAFVIRQVAGEPSVHWVQLGSASEIDDVATQWTVEIMGSDPRGLGSASEPLTSGVAVSERRAEKLRSLVWEPIEEQLGNCKTVIMIPDGSLSSIPWGAPPGGEPGSYLIEQYSIGLATSGVQLFDLLSSDTVGSDGLLAAGGIRYDVSPLENEIALVASNERSPAIDAGRVKWKFLEGSQREAEEIGGFFQSIRPESDAVLLSGDQADENSVLTGIAKSRYAHLATHGYFADFDSKRLYQADPTTSVLFNGPITSGLQQSTVAGRNPLLLSGLVLSGANLGPTRDSLDLPTARDGILTAEEVVGLDLHETELVTLSACQTGLGRQNFREGVFGLRRAFHQSGARCVVASLWKVDDNATRALMVEFYRNLWEKRQGKLLALCEAQREMIRSYNQKSGAIRGLGQVSLPIPVGPSNNAKPPVLPPYFWAAFQLSGDWR